MRRMALSMPDIRIAVKYMDWIQANAREVEMEYSFILESTDTWRLQYGEEEFQKFIRSMITKGHPSPVWTLCITRNRLQQTPSD